MQYQASADVVPNWSENLFIESLCRHLVTIPANDLLGDLESAKKQKTETKASQHKSCIGFAIYASFLQFRVTLEVGKCVVLQRYLLFRVI